MRNARGRGEIVVVVLSRLSFLAYHVSSSHISDPLHSIRRIPYTIGVELEQSSAISKAAHNAVDKVHDGGQVNDKQDD